MLAIHSETRRAYCRVGEGSCRRSTWRVPEPGFHSKNISETGRRVAPEGAGARKSHAIDEDSEAYNLVLAELERLELAQANMRQRRVLCASLKMRRAKYPMCCARRAKKSPFWSWSYD